MQGADATTENAPRRVSPPATDNPDSTDGQRFYCLEEEAATSACGSVISITRRLRPGAIRGAHHLRYTHSRPHRPVPAEGPRSCNLSCVSGTAAAPPSWPVKHYGSSAISACACDFSLRAGSGLEPLPAGLQLRLVATLPERRRRGRSSRHELNMNARLRLGSPGGC